VIDDGSTDGTASWVARNYPSVKLVRQANQGVSVARNNGVDHASYDLIAFCDSDDLMLPGRLAMQYAFLAAHPTVDLVAGNYIIFNSTFGLNDKPQFDHSLFGIRKGSADVVTNFYKVGSRVGNPLFNTAMIRKSALLSTKGFAPDLRRCEDFELAGRISSLGFIGIIDKPLMLFRSDFHERISSEAVAYNHYEAMVDHWLRNHSDLYRNNKRFREHVNIWAGNVMMQGVGKKSSSEILKLLRKYRFQVKLIFLLKLLCALPLMRLEFFRKLMFVRQFSMTYKS